MIFDFRNEIGHNLNGFLAFRMGEHPNQMMSIPHSASKYPLLLQL